MTVYPNPESWEYANERQAKRAARSFKELESRGVPVCPGPLIVDDDLEVSIQTPRDVACRTLVLWAVDLRAEGVSKQEVSEILDDLHLWNNISPKERTFLQDDEPDPVVCQQLVWRLECIWVLLWALGYIDRLDWPSGMCEVPKLVEILQPHEADADFIALARLRPVAEILDAQDLIMRIHWAIRDAYLSFQDLPMDLIWSSDSEMVPANVCAAVGVVEQRHHTLNWLVKCLHPSYEESSKANAEDWDHVDTPT